MTPSIIRRTFTDGIWSASSAAWSRLVGRGHEPLRPAVVDDVRHLLGGEPGAHRRVVEPGVVGAPDHREEAGSVLEAEGHVVARLQAGRSEHVREAVGLGVELGVGDDLAAGGHDHGGLVGGGGGEVSREHGGKVAAGTVAPCLTTRRRGSRRWWRAPAASWSLDEALLLIAAHAAPDLDIAARAGTSRRARRRACRSPRSTGSGSTSSRSSASPATGTTYHDPRNSLLPDVLDRRLGIPISLAVLAMEVGRRCGVALVGVGMPGTLRGSLGGGAAPLPGRVRRRPGARPRRLPGRASRGWRPGCPGTTRTSRPRRPRPS